MIGQDNDAIIEIEAVYQLQDLIMALVIFHIRLH